MNFQTYLFRTITFFSINESYYVYGLLNNLLVGDDSPQPPNLSAVLQQLSAQVEGNVFGVDHAFDEPHPLGHDLLGLALDQDLPAVERNANAAIFARLEKS
jgi:hypothetical protein